MTPQLTLPQKIAAHVGPTHLTEDQFSDLLARSPQTDSSNSAPSQAHLLTCEQCAAELATLRESLSLFRRAASAYADDELRRLPQMSLPSRRIFSPALEPTWLVAAAAIFLAALLPMQLARQHSFQPARALSASVSTDVAESESDEALLDDVDRDTSASVPAPMQALVDPMAGISSTSTGTSIQSSAQRKD
jgi:anti-sigma factor RsiW